MHDELASEYRDVLGDLHTLAINEPSRLLCSDFRGLARLVLSHLGVEGQISGDCRAEMLMWLLPKAVDDMRERALRVLVANSHRRDMMLFKAAAATELLKVHKARWDDQRKRLLAIRRGERPGDSEVTTRPRYDRLLAAAWLGVGRTTLPSEDDDELFLAFIEEMLGFLLEPTNRKYLQDLIAQCEPPAPVVQPAVQAPARTEFDLAGVVNESNARSVSSSVQDLLSRFAGRVRRQLEYEQLENRFADPLPIWLRWSRVDESGLVDDPGVAAFYFGHTTAASIAGVPETLEGVAELFHQGPAGRLVVLGGEGSGKSTLVTELALELIKMRGTGDPVPIVFQLGSWNHDVAFEDWLIAELVGAYDFLKVKSRDERKSLGCQLVEDGHILAILDGFDEIPDVLRQSVIARLNETLMQRDKVVVTSRIEEYVQAVSGESGQVLKGAEVVRLQELSLDDIDRYLRERSTTLEESGGSPPTPWDPVIRALRDDKNRTAHVEMLLGHFATPLMLMLAKVAYSNADPAELLDGSIFPTPRAVQECLLNGFVEARIGRASRRGGAGDFSCTSDEARYWLGFIAATLVAERNVGIAWWKLVRDFVASFALRVLGVVLSIVAGLIAGRIMFQLPLLVDIAAAVLTIPLFVAIIPLAGLSEDPVHLDWKNVVPMLRATFLEGEYYLPLKAFGFNGRLNIFLALLFASGPAAIVNTVSSVAAGGTFFVGMMLIFYSMIASTPYSLTQVIDPQRLFRLDRDAALKRAKIYFLVSSIPVAMLLLATWDLSYLWTILLLAMASFVLANSTASGTFLVGSYLLAYFGLLPQRSMSFLRYAHKRGVLRQFGGEYQFRHELLRDSLAHWFVHENARHPRIVSGVVKEAAENLSRVDREDRLPDGSV